MDFRLMTWRTRFLWVVAGGLALAGCGMVEPVAVPAATPPVKVALPEFEKPPMPNFMLRRDGPPLTLEQMRQQADEAARRVRPQQPAPAPISPKKD